MAPAVALEHAPSVEHVGLDELALFVWYQPEAPSHRVPSLAGMRWADFDGRVDGRHAEAVR